MHTPLVRKKPKGGTFADLVREPTWSETERPSWQTAVRPGRFNRAGVFFDPDCRPMTQAPHDIGEDEARRWVADGRSWPSRPVAADAMAAARHNG